MSPEALQSQYEAHVPLLAMAVTITVLQLQGLVYNLHNQCY